MYLPALTLARHLLGKKSWNVYNADNIAKVKHDEALAAAREAAEEQRMQEADAENRIRVLRGLPAVPSEPLNDDHAKKHERRRDQEQGRDRKRRRIAGEDETEREIRIARENAAVAPGSKPSTVQTRPRNDMPLMDGKGHINLFPIETSSNQKPAKNAEAEAEAAKKKREYEDQYTMRFSNAAGFKQNVGQLPWYSSVDANTQNGDDGATATVAKDVWGNEDPRRKDRYTKRLTANDPLSAMKRGVEELREVEKERNRWKEERDRDIQELIDSERPSRSFRKKGKSGEIDRFESDDERPRRRRRSEKKRKSGDENGFYSEEENASSRRSRKKERKPGGNDLDSLDESRSDALPPKHSSDHHHHQKRQKRNVSKEHSSQQSHHARPRGRSRDRSYRQRSRHRRPDHLHHRTNSSIEKQEEPAMAKVPRQEAQRADAKR